MVTTTLVLPVSRPDYLKRIFAQYDRMTFDDQQTGIFVLVDGNLQLYEQARELVLASRFVEKNCIYRKKGVPNIGSVWRRRERISAIHNELKELLPPSQFLFLTEDDTLLPLNALPILYENYIERAPVGFVSGIQIGRWGFMSLGSYVADDVYNPSLFTSSLIESGVTNIDAAGFYCCLVKQEQYKSHTFEPFHKILGPDVTFGLSLRQQGLENYINHDIKCGHLTKHGVLDFSQPIIQLEVRRVADQWRQGAI